MRGIYAHKNKLNGEIFYIGQQRVDNDRAYDFKNQRSEKWHSYVNSIGPENVEVVWLYESNDENENLFPIESKFQKEFYIKGTSITTELVQMGELNPNYGNRWSPEQKQHMSDYQTGRYAGDKNPMYGVSMAERLDGFNGPRYKHWRESRKGKWAGDKNPTATSCVLYGPEDVRIEFKTLKDATEWASENITHHKFNNADTINGKRHVKDWAKELYGWHLERVSA